MQKAKRDLKSISVILIVLGAIDFIGSLISVFAPSGSNSLETLTQIVNYTVEEANTTIVIVTIVAAIAFLLQLFVGLKGIIVANGGRKSALATIIIVLCIILLVLGISYSVGMIVRGQADVFTSQVIIQVCELLLYIFYIVYTNKVVSLRRTTV